MNEIKKVVNSKANVIKLLSVSETAPINCIQGDMYYNTSTNLIYISNATNTWSEEGKEPIEGYLYVDLEKAKMYYYDGTFFANYGGTSNEIVISEEQPTTEDWKIWIDTDEVNNLGSEVVDTLEGNETNKAPSVRAVKEGIIESGSNENGNYVKYIDGTMICYVYKSFTTGSTYGDFMWQFPENFIDTNFSVIAPNVVTAGDSGQYTCGENARTNSYCQFIVYKNNNNYAGKTRTINIFAIGRWK